MPADRGYSVRRANIRFGGQQWPDDRGNLRQSSYHRDVSADRATVDRPGRDQKAAGFVPAAPDRDVAGKIGCPRGSIVVFGKRSGSENESRTIKRAASAPEPASGPPPAVSPSPP